MNSEFAIETVNSSAKSNSSQSANTIAMSNTLVELNESSEGMKKAKADLDAAVAYMMTGSDMYTDGELDPFKQMMYAVYNVLPGTMLFKEEKLLYDTDNFKFVSELNNHMTEMLDYYRKSGDYKADTNVGKDNETGLATSGMTETAEGSKAWWGKAAAEAYYAKANELLGMLDVLPEDIRDVFEGALDDIVGLGDGNAKILANGLWNGLQGPYRAAEGAEHACVPGTINGGSHFANGCDYTGSTWSGSGQYAWTGTSAQHVMNGFRPGSAYGYHDVWFRCGKETEKVDCMQVRLQCTMEGETCWLKLHQSNTAKYQGQFQVLSECRGHFLGAVDGDSTEYTRYKKTMGTNDLWDDIDGNGLITAGGSKSLDRTTRNQDTVNETTTANTTMMTSLNSYSAMVGAEYTFDMEQYSAFVAANSSTMNEHIAQVGASSSRLTRLSHA